MRDHHIMIIKRQTSNIRCNQTSHVYKWNDMVLSHDLHHVHRGMITIIPLCISPRSMELTHYECCKSIDLYFYLQHHHIMTLDHQQSKLYGSNLSIASFTWL